MACCLLSKDIPFDFGCFWKGLPTLKVPARVENRPWDFAWGHWQGWRKSIEDDCLTTGRATFPSPWPILWHFKSYIHNSWCKTYQEGQGGIGPGFPLVPPQEQFCIHTAALQFPGEVSHPTNPQSNQNPSTRIKHTHIAYINTANTRVRESFQYEKHK